MADKDLGIVTTIGFIGTALVALFLAFSLQTAYGRIDQIDDRIDGHARRLHDVETRIEYDIEHRLDRVDGLRTMREIEVMATSGIIIDCSVSDSTHDFVLRSGEQLIVRCAK